MTGYVLYRRSSVLFGVLVMIASLASCASDGRTSAPRAGDAPAVALNADRDERPGVTVEPILSTVVDARPLALVDGRAVTFGDLRPALTELAGAQALREHVLDSALADAIADAGLFISTDAMESERRRLLETLSDDPETSLRLLDELRGRQGLGPERFRSLLTRNASLRALVGSRVAISSSGPAFSSAVSSALTASPLRPTRA